MKRKNLLPVLLFAFSATLLLLIVGLQGSFFQASLLGEDSTSSGFTMPQLTTSGATFQPLELDMERTMTYRENLRAASENGIGVYFPNIYTTTALEGDFMIPLAYDNSEVQPVSSELTIEMTYPPYVKYAGLTSSENAFGTMQIDNPEEGVLRLAFNTTGTGILLPMSIPDFLQLPFSINKDTELQSTAAFGIRSFTVQGVDGTEMELPFARGTNSILTFSNAATLNTGRPVMTDRAVVTREYPNLNVPQTNSNTVPPVTQVNRAPYVTADDTRISPTATWEGSGDTVFMYVSVADPDGHGDVRSVLADLSPFGFGPQTPLLKVETTPTYAVYATSFVLPDTIRGQDIARNISFVVTDTANNMSRGALSFTVKQIQQQGATVTTTSPLNTTTPVVSQPQTNTNTTSTALTSSFAADFDQDGDVDADDLKAYINVYEQEVAR